MSAERPLIWLLNDGLQYSAIYAAMMSNSTLNFECYLASSYFLSREPIYCS